MANQNLELSEAQSDLEAKWEEDFVFELRVRGVSGRDIGAALSEVKSHIIESGNTAAGTFGDPVLYARALDIPANPMQSKRMILPSVIAIAFQTAGCMTVLAATRALTLSDPQAEIPSAGVILCAVAFVVIFAAAEPIMRFVGKHPGWATAITGGFFATMVLGNFLLPPLEVPHVVAWVIGFLLLVIGTVGGVRATASPSDNDPIVDPLNPTANTNQGIRRWIRWAPVFLLPTFTVFAAILFPIILSIVGG